MSKKQINVSKKEVKVPTSRNIDIHNLSSIKYQTSFLEEKQQIVRIHQDGSGIEKNTLLKKKTEDIQNEFDVLMSELVNRRGKAAAEEIMNIGDHMGEMIDNYHMPGPAKRHSSPTKRLISMKNSALEHKKMFKGVRDDVSENS